MDVIATLRLAGGGGETVDFRRTLASHGVAMLTPQRIDQENWVLDTTLVVDGQAQTIKVREASPGLAVVEAASRPADQAARARLVMAVRHLLRLDEDLSPFYALAAADPCLAWVTSGAGRMLRSLTVFEDVIHHQLLLAGHSPHDRGTGQRTRIRRP